MKKRHGCRTAERLWNGRYGGKYDGKYKMKRKEAMAGAVVQVRTAALQTAVITVLLLAAAVLLTSCGAGTSGGQYITAVSREEGSGTRSAFTSIFGIEAPDENGKMTDATSDYSEVTNSTSVMIMTVRLNKNAVGYISLGTVNDDVKTVTVDGVSPTVENIKSGRYGAVRSFSIVTKETNSPSAAERDFTDFIMSEEGQKIIEEKGYVNILREESGDAAEESEHKIRNNASSMQEGDKGAELQTKRPKRTRRHEGHITVSGSSSVAPVMEALKEAYTEINPSADIEIQQSDSTQGITAVREGICDIGMTSRSLSESEREAGLEAKEIARDGIVIIINKDNPVNNLTGEEIRGIYMGTVKSWGDIEGAYNFGSQKAIGAMRLE